MHNSTAARVQCLTELEKNELEASVMVSRGAEKRGVGVQMLKTVRNPILFAKELLGRGAEEGVPHNCLSGEEAERLAKEWGCEIVDESYFWTEKRWKEHMRGLEMEGLAAVDDKDEYLPQGTVGCVALDVHGVLCTATSTGGLTNKIPGRIGDTPTIAAGFWAEEWEVPAALSATTIQRSFLAGSPLSNALHWISDCIPSPSLPSQYSLASESEKNAQQSNTRAVALSGTGNGDYFLRLAAAHNVAARCRFANKPLKTAMQEVIGVGGEMQRSAGDRWGKGDGAGGFIGIDSDGVVCMDMNSGGMFRGTVVDGGKPVVAVYRDEELHF